ncbi:MAG: nitrate reductase cytochrome c-type subunit [Caenispirillum bisanense]|nr:nitrate reductase cytochrome c-type subunit [Caenispirillum bisanense]MCA1972469.1 nitrate reductase cytochrome c-type subunit [Caenispirillum sp.]
MRRLVLSVLVTVAGISVAVAQGVPGLEGGLDPEHPLTGPDPLPRVTQADPMPPEIVDDIRQRRSYPEQPPVIPHSIRGYEVNLRTNKCLTCHSREYAAQVQAPMISVTHYVDRDQQMLAGVAPRRYTCRLCHVPQTKAVPPVENTFLEIGTLATGRGSAGDGGR